MSYNEQLKNTVQIRLCQVNLYDSSKFVSPETEMCVAVLLVEEILFAFIFFVYSYLS